MDVSIIVPIYKGNRYIPRIQDMLNRNVHYMKNEGRELQVELILVNDYPDEPLVVDESLFDGYQVKIIENEKNSGIHQTRVNGLLEALGKYILFLDQDDEITENCILSQFDAVKDYDIVVGNGYRGIKGQYRRIYRNKHKQELSTKEKYFVKAANQIVSPGHCLIKKDSIPKEWYEYIITANGGDDLFLWLLMFEMGCRFGINQECIYKHVETGENLSNDLDAMYSSSDNVIRVGRECGTISRKTLDDYERRIAFLRGIKSSSLINKVFVYARNLDICVLKVYAFYR